MTSLATVRVIGLVLLASPLVLVDYAAWIVCLRSASLNWMLRASPCRRLYARFLCSRAHSAHSAARPSARATIGNLVYNVVACHLAVVPASAVVRMSPDC